MLFTDTQRVGDPAHGSRPQQVMVHTHRQVAGDVLIFNVFMSLQGKEAARDSVLKAMHSPSERPQRGPSTLPSSHRPIDIPVDRRPGESNGLAGQVHHLVLPHVQRGADGDNPRLPCGEGTSRTCGSWEGEQG